MVVRQGDGTLRHALPSERNRYFHIYFPEEGRMYKTPEMFRENLDVCYQKRVFHKNSNNKI